MERKRQGRKKKKEYSEGKVSNDHYKEMSEEEVTKKKKVKEEELKEEGEKTFYAVNSFSTDPWIKHTRKRELRKQTAVLTSRM